MKNNTKIEFKTFDRNKVFNYHDISVVQEIISYIPDSKRSLENKLFGLFDGYWYIDLQVELGSVKEVPSFKHYQLSNLIRKIENYISNNQ